MTKGNFDRFGQFDEYAAQVAKRLAAVDRHRLKGGDVQFEAILHSAIVEAMFHGAQAQKCAECARFSSPDAAVMMASFFGDAKC